MQTIALIKLYILNEVCAIFNVLIAFFEMNFDVIAQVHHCSMNETKPNDAKVLGWYQPAKKYGGGEFKFPIYKRIDKVGQSQRATTSFVTFQPCDGGKFCVLNMGFILYVCACAS